MWSYPIPLNQDTLTCVLIDSAYQLTNFKKGDTTMILQKTIEDWAIYNSKMELIKGSFSEKYLKGKE